MNLGGDITIGINIDDKATRQVKEVSENIRKNVLWNFSEITKVIKNSNGDVLKTLKTIKTNGSKTTDILETNIGKITDISEKVEDVGHGVKKHTKIFKDAYGNIVKQQTKVVKGMKEFKAYLLSTMFLGMRLRQTMAGIMAPAVDAFGITDILSAMYLDVMAPAMETVAEKIYGLVDSVSNMSDGEKEAIGWTVLLGYGMGTLIEGLSSGALGVLGLIEAFGKLTAPIKTVISAMPDTFTAIETINAAINKIPSSVLSIINVAVAVGLTVVFFKELKDISGGTLNFKEKIWSLFVGAIALAGAASFLGVGTVGVITIGLVAAVTLAFASFGADWGNLKTMMIDVYNGIVKTWNDLVKGTRFAGMSITPKSGGSISSNLGTAPSFNWSTPSGGVMSGPSGYTPSGVGNSTTVNNNVTVNITATKIDPKMTWDAIQPQFRSDITKYLNANSVI